MTTGRTSQTHHTLTLETLERISGKEGVIEITGDYDTGSWLLPHEHRRHDEDVQQSKSQSAVSASQSTTSTAQTKEPMKEEIQETRKTHRRSKYLVAVYTAAGIIGAIALAGFVISGGMLPNSNSGIQSTSGTGLYCRN